MKFSPTIGARPIPVCLTSMRLSRVFFARRARDGEDRLYLLLEGVGQVVAIGSAALAPYGDSAEVGRSVVHSTVSTADLDVADVARVGVVGIAQTRTEVGTQVLVIL